MQCSSSVISLEGLGLSLEEMDFSGKVDSVELECYTVPGGDVLL